MGQTSTPKTKTKKASATKAKPDRSLVEGGEDYPVRELAVATGISVDEADALVEKHGLSSGKAAEAAREMQRERDEEEAARA
jgi:hypothetical protein